MMFNHSRGGVFKIGPGALDAMRGFEQHAPDATEAGGFLLGRYLRDGWDIVVDVVTVPQPDDQRSRNGFVYGSHQALIDEAWESSAGHCNCVGNWHTHAEPVPIPSPIDIADWKRVLRTDIRDDEACFFVIVGTAEIRVWEGNHRTGQIVRLEPRAASIAA